MVEHLVAVRWKPSATPAEVEAVLTALRGLPAAIPCILELQCGKGFSPERAHGYQLGLRVRLAGRAELAEYADHPAHVAVKRRIGELAEDVLALDFES